MSMPHSNFLFNIYAFVSFRIFVLTFHFIVIIIITITVILPMLSSTYFYEVLYILCCVVCIVCVFRMSFWYGPTMSVV